MLSLLLGFVLTTVAPTSSQEPFTCYASTLVRGSQMFESTHRFHSVASREALNLCRENSPEEQACYLSHCEPLIE